MRVMIVDDAPEVRNLLAAVVRKEGHEVIVAADAASAWDLLDPLPELIFADVDMPGETGVQFVLRLRSRAGCARLPVIFVTAYRDRAAALATADPSVIDVIDKPFRIETIAQALRTVLGNAGSAAGAG